MGLQDVSVGLCTGPYLPRFASDCISHLSAAGGEGRPRALFPLTGFKPPSALLPNLIVTSQSGIWAETHKIRVSNL